MDQYPYGYSAYHGQPPQHFYPYQLDPNLQTPSYAPQDGRNVEDSHSASLRQSYEQNRSIIPGLAFGVSSHDGGLHQQWPAPEEPNLIAASHYYQEVPASEPLDSRTVEDSGVDHPTGQPTIPPADDTAEEGEVSEGEYDDLYEPGDPESHHDLYPAGEELDTMEIISGPANGHIETGDNQWYGHALNQQDTVVKAPVVSKVASGHAGSFEEHWVPAHSGRDRSGSYSPYLSPREIHHSLHATGSVTSNDAIKLGPESRILGSEWQSDIQPMLAAPGDTVPSYSPMASLYRAGRDYAPPATSNGNGPQSSTWPKASVDSRVAEQHPADPVAEAKKKAQAAILNLLPLDVRYQNYIEEGIDGSIVKSLFSELGLDTTFPQPTNTILPRYLPSESQPQPPFTVPQPSAEPAKKSQDPQHSIPATTTVVAKDATTVQDKSEERKDRIARLLAAKATKPSGSTGPPSTSGSMPTPSEPRAGSAAAVNSQHDQNEKGLKQQQKLDALIKSRETRAQKAAQPKDLQDLSSAATSSVPAAPSLLHPDPLNTHPDTTNSQKPLGAHDHHDSTSSAAGEGTPASQAQTGHIPGLYLSSTHPMLPNNPRKRPVASDFVDYPATNRYKRPFGLNRPDRPLVIDVSDESDDEDVEMDIGSPTDEPSAIQRVDSPARKLGSFRDFPPLTDAFPPRHYASPAPVNLVSPPSGMPPGQVSQGGLEAMNQQIETMKKQIALAEARQKLKNAVRVRPSLPKSNGPTPEDTTESDASKPPTRRVQSVGASDAPNGRPSPVTPEPSSSRLPKASGVAQNGEESSRARRIRIASQSIPTIEARLQAKKSKLRLLQSEVARLEREVQAELAEKERLAAEVEQLDSDPEDEAEDGEQLSKAVSVEAREPEASEHDAAYQPSTNSESAVATPAVPPEFLRDSQYQSTDFNAAADANAAGLLSDRNASRLDPTPLDNPSLYAETEVPGGLEDITTQADISMPIGVPISNASPSEVVSSRDDKPTVDPTMVVAGPNDSPSDVLMQDPNQSRSLSQEHDDMSDIYHPPSANSQEDDVGPALEARPHSPAHLDGTISLEMSDVDIQETPPGASPLPEQISIGMNELTPDEGVQPAREVQSDGQALGLPKSIFTPYESPLQYFRAYRYHPKYRESVAGGLRSLTYSNKIDAKVPVCPYQLDGQECPKGRDCEYQHFESMKLPDDQILLQLGSTTLEGAEKATFNNGLRELLHNLRSRNIKDFPSIAQGIVDYHNRVSGDPSRILPLGDITI